MKIAVLADIHANLPALQAISADIDAWQPDLTIVAGDIVNRGPSPAECLNFVLERKATRGWLVMRGNHEDYVISQAAAGAPRSGPAFEVHRPSFWTYQQLGCDVSVLASMPEQIILSAPDHSSILIYHASIIGNREGIYPETSDDELASKVGYGHLDSPASLFVVGHTHRPLIRQCRQTLVVNVGSAGLPFDGDTRPSYSRIEWEAGEWQAVIQRVAYDLQHTVRDMHQSGYLHDAGPLSQVVYQELVGARSLLYGWAVGYQSRVINHEISMSASVDLFLNENIHQLGKIS